MLEEPPESDASAALASLFERQRTAFVAEPCPLRKTRQWRLSRLIVSLRRHQDRLCAAMDQDFGGRSLTESRMADLLGTVLAARHAQRNVKRWMRPSRRATERLFWGNSARVEYQPKGVVGIIAPWNFPVYLALGPLVAAIAAGNRSLIKGSEYTPRTNAVLAEVLDEALGVGEVPVIAGSVAVGRAFAALPFDHLVFTGAPAVAPEVMAAAARNLTPVTLELGGKSPVIVAPGADLDRVAVSVAHGKSFNAGQICVSPDYALVSHDETERFADAVLCAANRLGESRGAGYESTAIVSDRQFARLQDLIADAEGHGARIRYAVHQPNGRRHPLVVITGVTETMRVAREELFGPILPIVGYSTVEDAIAYVAARPRPLALYPFGFDRRALGALLGRTHSGGVTVNDWGWHVFNHDLPFGGIGMSGMGSYHGVEGFRELSHARAIFETRRWFPMSLFRPPYGGWLQRLALRAYLGKPR